LGSERVSPIIAYIVVDDIYCPQQQYLYSGPDCAFGATSRHASLFIPGIASRAEPKEQ
jgi:hypothetical protein